MIKALRWLAFMLLVCYVSGTHGAACLAESAAYAKTNSHTPNSAPQLRSAWMLTESKSSLPPWASTPAEEQTQLQDHFRCVESILVVNTQNSLAIAAWRFEHALGRTLTPSQRVRLLGALYARRLTQIAQLQAYREAGKFPLNETPQAPPRPIFVDDHGTACAVGHLMVCAGWQSHVESIAHTNNYVVLPDVYDGPLFAWILQSGLIQEEAALIQPFYNPPMLYRGPLSQFLQAGAHLEQGVLRFDNFTFSTSQSGTAAVVNPSNIQLSTDLSDIINDPWTQPSQRFHPNGDFFFALHGTLGATSGTDSILWRLGYDVTATVPDATISAAYLTSDRNHLWTFGGNFTLHPITFNGPEGPLLSSRAFGDDVLNFDGYARYQTSIATHGLPLGSISIGDPNLTDFGGLDSLLSISRGLSFTPAQSLHVETQLLLAGNALSFDIVNEFTVVGVPEPTTLVLAALGLAVLASWRLLGRRY